MRFIPILGAALIAIPAAAAAAQPAGSSAPMPPTGATAPATGAAPSTSAPSTSAAPSTAPSASASATVTAGLPVKDKAGVAIGQIADVKTDASGKRIATIHMGADSFAVDTAALAVDNGTATINATQAQIKAMLPKK